jgi:short subunit dehydrogenase-like uncharacterized protein
MAREFDVVVFGATGFTGSLVVEYIWRHYGSAVKMAAAGRNEAKLKASAISTTRSFRMEGRVV